MADFDFRDRLPETIKTPRLILRAPCHDDVSAIARLANNKNIFQMMARLPYPYTEEDAVHFIDHIARSRRDHAYSVLTRDENFIGIVGLAFAENESPELGYWLGEPYWGEGYGSEAAIALVEAADAAGCAKLRSRARSENRASLGVLARAGFRITGQRVGDCGHHKGVAMTYLEREART